MAYLFRKITDYDPASQEKYFFDANVWIAALKNSASIRNRRDDEPYVEFFDAVISLASITDERAIQKLKKQGKYQPKIIMTSLLMSEIFNAYMKGIAYSIYINKNSKDKTTFKFKDYRQTDDHEEKLQTLKDDFLAFYDYLELMDDNFSKINPKAICTQLRSQADFNDHYYYELLYDYQIPIVTHDGDFIFQDLEIITINGRLLSI